MNANIRTLAASLSDISSRCPAEKLDRASRYVIAADIRMGDGGRRDESVGSMKALYRILSKWYLPRDYTLVLNGDVEDLRTFWIKDILAAWPRIYALFDVFADKGRLRKIAGERDLTLLKLKSYPYEILHGLRLDAESGSILICHGHQASSPYLGREYLSDFLQHWLHSSPRRRPEAKDSDGASRYKAERRLCRAAASLGMALVEGHTRRPLFESITNRDAIRLELERMLNEGDPGSGESTVDALIDYCRSEAKRRSRSGLLPVSGPGIALEGRASPALFCPGRAAGARGIRFIEISEGRIRLVRWLRDERSSPIARETEKGLKHSRIEVRSSGIDEVMERVAASARPSEAIREGGET